MSLDNSLAELPPDMLGEIVSHLPVQDVINLCESSRRVTWICDREDIWRNFLQRDYPQVRTPPGADPRQVYIDLYRKTKERFARVIDSAKNQGLFWNARNPHSYTDFGKYLDLLRAGSRAQRPVVFWLDFWVAGTPEEIVDVLNKAHINTVQVGDLYRITNGALGDPPALLPLTEEVVRHNSFDPRNPDQAPYAEMIQRALHEETSRRRADRDREQQYRNELRRLGLIEF